ncbi:hypothetical protein HOC_03887 [Hyphomonas oceanitis SCH89]|uniref:DUF4167 domain-containing protein n=2 Tax=Hyphomonas oceanitis TaxID=81033 RepID=A0A059GAI5_9PROT|nr:hypothetical protein HOC_03887 [Hyphomonas oceanitis SCH89]
MREVLEAAYGKSAPPSPDSRKTGLGHSTSFGNCAGNCLQDKKQAHETGYTFMKRSRGRNRRSGGNNNNNNHNNPNRHYESVGPDVKIRGSAQQVLEKYQQYARDAQTSGDRVLSEAYFQFAEHYQRIVAKQMEAKDRQQPQQRNGRDDRDNRRDDRDNRNDSSDDDSNSDDSNEEATVQVTSRSRPDDNQDDRDNARDTDNDNGKPDSLKVIDASDDSDSSKAEAPKESRSKPKADGDRPKSRRKPYRAKDASEEPEAVTDGVMKTLSRGRRKSASSETDEQARADDSAETTAD